MSRLKTFTTEHKKPALFVGVFLLIIILAVVGFILLSPRESDGSPGTDSSAADASMKEDAAALKNYKIASYLPIISKDPAYTISYHLDRDDAGNYSLKLVLNAFSASARTDMIKRLLNENFGGEDPLNYKIELENYYNPFTNVDFNNLPDNLTKGELYKFGDSTYTAQIFYHTLYDGSKNVYRVILENGKPKTALKLFFTYEELPFLDSSVIRSINNLE